MSPRGSTGEVGRAPPALTRASIPRIRLAALLLAVALALALSLAARAEGYVYWANHGVDEGPGSIGRANLDGTGADTDFITTANGACGIAVDPAHVYWTNLNTDTIGRANLDGTGVDESFVSASTTSNSCGVAVDDKHQYWVSKSGDDSGTGAIGRANLDGTDVDESFITGVSFPSGPVAVDGSHLYWSSFHPGFSPGTLYIFPTRIGRANLDGTGVDQDFITNAIAVQGLAVDDTHVWWAWAHRFEGGIARANLDGADVETSVIGGGEDFSGYAVAVDDTYVYWRGVFDIGRAKLDGSRANHELITGAAVNIPGGVAVDGLGPPPANQFSFDNLKKNQRKGTAKLTVKVPGSGELELAKTKRVKADDQLAGSAGREKLGIKPRRKAKQKLNRRGKAKVKAVVTYTPDGGEPSTQTKRLRLVKRR